jgi:hypothetical protein
MSDHRTSLLDVVLIQQAISTLLHERVEMSQSQAPSEAAFSDRSATNQGHAFNHAPAAPQAPQHAFTHASAALRIFRFAADSAPRVLKLAHVSAFLRECAVEFGSADAALPGAMRNEYASGLYFRLRSLYFELRDVVERNAARCPWLAAKLLACRSGAPMPAAALAPDVTRHDVNWGAEGARRHADLAVSGDGYALRLTNPDFSDFVGFAWAQGTVGVTSGKHWFSVTVMRSNYGNVKVGWVDRAVRTDDDSENGPGNAESSASGATFKLKGQFRFGTAPLTMGDQFKDVPKAEYRCTMGCLLDADAGAMTVFINGEPLEGQCEYKFPTDREWFPSVALAFKDDALFSNAV